MRGGEGQVVRGGEQVSLVREWISEGRRGVDCCEGRRGIGSWGRGLQGDIVGRGA